MAPCVRCILRLAGMECAFRPSGGTTHELTTGNFFNRSDPHFWPAAEAALIARVQVTPALPGLP